MTVMEKIKRFINEKILKRESRKLLMAPNDTEEPEENAVNLSAIQNFLKQDKYGRNLHVSFGKVKPSVKKSLLKRVETRFKWKVRCNT